MHAAETHAINPQRMTMMHKRHTRSYVLSGSVEHAGEWADVSKLVFPVYSYKTPHHQFQG